MSLKTVIVKHVTYSMIDNSTARTGTDEDTFPEPNAISKTFNGKVEVMPYVNIDGRTLTVVELGRFSFVRCSSIREIILPYTLKTLKRSCLNSLTVPKIIIPASVEIVESYFLNNIANVKNVTFCGNTAFKAEYVNSNTYIHGYSKPLYVPFFAEFESLAGYSNIQKIELSCVFPCQKSCGKTRASMSFSPRFMIVLFST